MDKSLDLKNIAIYVATGFFLDNDTYWIGKSYNDKSGLQNFQWHYSPKDITLADAVEEFEEIFQNVSKSIFDHKRIILPLSGGLDSRTQATLLRNQKNVNSYTYMYENGVREIKYGKSIAEVSKFNFNSYTITSGYLWHQIEKISDWNECYSDFTHPRQMAIHQEFSEMGDVFFLGHWGDVLFDTFKVQNKISNDELTEFIKGKILKVSGVKLAIDLWKTWQLEGTFDNYITMRISELLDRIDIDHPSAKVKAFKSLHWAPRWTNVNLIIFKKYHPTVLPYFDHNMLQFICHIPDELLANRKIQIEYIKTRSPQLAKIPWQPYDPKNLYNYSDYKSLSNLPLRLTRKIGRDLNRIILRKKVAKRNWELQFRGDENLLNLQQWLFKNPSLNQLVPKELVNDYYQSFLKKDPIGYSHAVSMLLTLSVFSKKFMG